MTKRKNIVSVPGSKAGEPDKQYQKRRGKWIDLSTDKEVPINLVDMLETYLQMDDPDYREEREKAALPEFPASNTVRDTNNIEKLTESIAKLTKTLESIGKVTNSRMVKREKQVPSIEPIKPKIEIETKKGYEKVVSSSGQVNYKNIESGKFVKKEEATRIPSTFEIAKRTYGESLGTFLKGSKNKYGEVTSPSLGREFLEGVFPITSLMFGAKDKQRSIIGNELRDYESSIRKNPKNKNLSNEQIDKMIEQKRSELTKTKAAPPNVTMPAAAPPNVTVPPTEKIDVRTLDKENPETPGKENRPAPTMGVNIIGVSDNILQKLADILKKTTSEPEKNDKESERPDGPSFNPLDWLDGKGRGRGGRSKTPNPEGPKPKTPILDKNGKPLRGAALKSAERKAATKAAEKAGVKGLEKAGVKAGVKAGGKALGKSLLKKIPLVGAGAGLVFGAQRLLEGDALGAGGEVLSGLASTVPGFGTAASVGLDAALAARDISKAYSVENQPEIDTNMVKPVVNTQTQNVSMASKQNQIFKDNKMMAAPPMPPAVNNINHSPSNVINNNTVANLPTAGPRGSLDLSKFA